MNTISINKPRLVKDYEKLTEKIRDQIKLRYPEGFIHHLISFTNKEGASVSAVPFETDDTYYLVRMTKQEAAILVEDDDDFSKEEIKLDFEEKHADYEDIGEDEDPAETKGK